MQSMHHATAANHCVYWTTQILYRLEPLPALSFDESM